MRDLVMALSALTLLAAPADAADRSRDAARQQKGEAQLAKILDGRVAGTPVDCIYLNRITSTDIVDRTAIVYRAGSTFYVNRPEAGLNSLFRGTILVTNTTLSQLCNVDVVRLIDQATQSQRGFVNLGNFVPYTRPDAQAD